MFLSHCISYKKSDIHAPKTRSKEIRLSGTIFCCRRNSSNALSSCMVSPPRPIIAHTKRACFVLERHPRKITYQTEIITASKIFTAALSPPQANKIVRIINIIN